MVRIRYHLMVLGVFGKPFFLLNSLEPLDYAFFCVSFLVCHRQGKKTKILCFDLFFTSLPFSYFELGHSPYYRPQRSCGQGYVFTRVRDSVHRGGLGQGEPPPRPGRTNAPPGPGRNPPRDWGEPPRPGRTPPGSRLQNTVYERPVRILLECILV